MACRTRASRSASSRARSWRSAWRRGRSTPSGGRRASRRIPAATCCAPPRTSRTFPRTLDEGDQPDTHRFHDPAWDVPAGELPDWWPGRDGQPLVYVTFGSVAGGFPQALPVYGLALRARGGPAGARAPDRRPRPRPRRAARGTGQRENRAVGAATGRPAPRGGGRGPRRLRLDPRRARGGPPARGRARCSPTSPRTPAASREVGAGISVEPTREDPGATTAPLRNAIETVLADPSYGERARAIADELRAEPPVDEAIPLLERLRRR